MALNYAKELISEGPVVIDLKAAWTKDRPSADVENEFIRQHGLSEYAKWHLIEKAAAELRAIIEAIRKPSS